MVPFFFSLLPTHNPIPSLSLPTYFIIELDLFILLLVDRFPPHSLSENASVSTDSSIISITSSNSKQMTVSKS